MILTLAFSPRQELHGVADVIKKCNRNGSNIVLTQGQYRLSPPQVPLVVSLS